MEHPAVAETAVISSPDPSRGEVTVPLGSTETVLYGSQGHRFTG